MDNISTALLRDSVYQSNSTYPDQAQLQEFISQWDINYSARVVCPINSLLLEA